MKRRNAALAAVLALLLASCGTRLPDSAFSDSAQPIGAGARRAAGTDTGGDTFDNGGTTDTTTAGGGGGTNTNTGASTATDNASSAPGDNAPNKASDTGVTDSTITIGNITAENGVLGDAFAPAVRGLRAWVAYTNAHGGIHGRQIALKTCDDREDRNRDLACAQQLVEQDHVFALLAVNSRSFGGAAQYLADHQVPVMGFPITNSMYRYPTMFSIYRNPYPRDGKTVGYNGNLTYTSGWMRWFHKTLNLTKAAVFTYDIDESKQAGDLFKKGMELEGMQVTEYTVSFAAPSFDQDVADMQKNGTEMIVDSMDDGANKKLCDAMARRKFSVKAKVSTVVVMSDKVGTDYNDTCRNSVYVPGFTLDYDDPSNPEIAKFRDAFHRYQPNLPLHQWALEAWLQGNLAKEYLNTSAPTRTGLVKYLDNVHDWNGNGVHSGLDWGKYDPSASRTRDCFTIAHWQDSAKGWTNASGSFPDCYPDAYQYQAPALEQGN